MGEDYWRFSFSVWLYLRKFRCEGVISFRILKTRLVLHNFKNLWCQLNSSLSLKCPVCITALYPALSYRCLTGFLRFRDFHRLAVFEAATYKKFSLFNLISPLAPLKCTTECLAQSTSRSKGPYCAIISDGLVVYWQYVSSVVWAPWTRLGETTLRSSTEFGRTNKECLPHVKLCSLPGWDSNDQQDNSSVP